MDSAPRPTRTQRDTRPHAEGCVPWAILPYCVASRVSQAAPVVKNPAAHAGDVTHRFHPWVGKMPWRSAWQPTLVFLPGEAHRQRSLVGCSPRGAQSQSRLKGLSTHARTHTWLPTTTSKLQSTLRGKKSKTNKHHSLKRQSEIKTRLRQNRDWDDQARDFKSLASIC